MKTGINKSCHFELGVPVFQTADGVRALELRLFFSHGSTAAQRLSGVSSLRHLARRVSLFTSGRRLRCLAQVDDAAFPFFMATNTVTRLFGLVDYLFPSKSGKLVPVVSGRYASTRSTCTRADVRFWRRHRLTLLNQ